MPEEGGGVCEVAGEVRGLGLGLGIWSRMYVRYL